MAFYDELYEDGEDGDSGEQSRLKNITEEKISVVQSFLKQYGATRWRFVYVGFGDQLIKNESQIYHPKSDSHTIADMERVKGLNYGNYELSYSHYALILGGLHDKYIENTTKVIVVPVTTKGRRKSILLEKKYHLFLEYDSYLDLESIQHISLERVMIGESKRRLLTEKTQLPIASPIIIGEIRKKLKSILDI